MGPAVSGGTDGVQQTKPIKRRRASEVSATLFSMSLTGSGSGYSIFQSADNSPKKLKSRSTGWTSARA